MFFTFPKTGRSKNKRFLSFPKWEEAKSNVSRLSQNGTKQKRVILSGTKLSRRIWLMFFIIACIS